MQAQLGCHLILVSLFPDKCFFFGENAMKVLQLKPENLMIYRMTAKFRF